MTGRLGQAVGWARQGLLTVGAVLGVACILLTLGAALFGLRPLVFESGSMSPTIKTGDLAISHRVDASSLHKGDIVSVPTGTGTRVTHRIVSMTHEGPDAILALRGDANTATDATPYRVSHADVVLFHVPRVGYVVGWLSGPMGLFLLGLYAAFLVSVLVKRTPESGPGEGGPGEPLSAEERVVPPSIPARKTSARNANDKARLMATGGLSVLLAAGFLSGAGAQSSVTPTLAAWTDQTPVTGTTLTAGTVPAPPPTGASGSTCAPLANATNQARGVVYTWPTAPASVTYTATVTGLTGATSSYAVVNGKATLTVTYDATVTTNRSVPTVTVTATAAPAGSSWSSTSTTLKSFSTPQQPSSDPTCLP